MKASLRIICLLLFAIMVISAFTTAVAAGTLSSSETAEIPGASDTQTDTTAPTQNTAPDVQTDPTNQTQTTAPYESDPAYLDYEYAMFDDGTLRITKYKGASADVTIPASCQGYSVSNIGENAFSGNAAITSVVIPDSVKSINDNAFENCFNLKSVTFGAGLTRIGDCAFLSCVNLKSVTIPPNITHIGDEALGFYYNSQKDEDFSLPGFTIYGYSKTAAERYAKSSELTFVSLNVKSSTPPDNSSEKINTSSASAKKNQSLTVKAKKITVKANRKTALVAAKYVKVSKAAGKLSYKLIKGNKTIISVAKNGKLTIKKGIKKGAYTVKIKISAAGNAQYNSASKTVTVKIKVK